MNLLIDERVDRHVVDKLRQDGHNVVYVFGELVFRRQQINAGVLLVRLAGFCTTLTLNWSPRWCAITLQNCPERSAYFHLGMIRIRNQP